MAGWLPPAPRAVLFPLINCSHSDKLIREQPVTWWSPGLALYVNTECQQCDQVYPFLFWFRSYLVSQHDGTLIILRVEHSCGRSVAWHTWHCEGTQDTSHNAHYQTVRGHKTQVILLITRLWGDTRHKSYCSLLITVATCYHVPAINMPAVTRRGEQRTPCPRHFRLAGRRKEEWKYSSAIKM